MADQNKQDGIKELNEKEKSQVSGAVDNVVVGDGTDGPLVPGSEDYTIASRRRT